VLVNGTDVQIDVSTPWRWDVIIIGGRVAGASTALLLARAGLRVFVVERARRGSDTVSTHALMHGGVLQLHRWGLLDRVAATGAPPVRRVTFHYGHDSMPVTLKPYAGVDALYAPRRTVLDALLVGAAEEAGARFGFGLAMTDVARDRAGRVVGVVVRDHLGATRTERAGLVVGADGRTSLVASQVGAPTVVAGSHAAAYVYGYWPAAHLDGYHWHYGDELSAGVTPTNDGLACVFAAGHGGGARRADAPQPPAGCGARAPGEDQLPAHRPHSRRAARPGPILPRPPSPIASGAWTGLGAGRRCRWWKADRLGSRHPMAAP
jgi:2-polyprenyl-6-methoxyphenol hydroxylase-like FAD-dependent oxidoreductase